MIEMMPMTNSDLKPSFSVMASAPEGIWSDREMAAGRKLTGIAIKEIGNGKKEETGNWIARIRAR